MPNYSWAFGTSKECNPIVGMSSRTKNFRSPSKLAIRGLEAALSGDIRIALECEKQLNAFEREIEGGLFYTFLDDYNDAWPFHLKAPWVSAFTQGVTLEFYIELAKKTGDSHYKNKADKIFLSYLVPIEKGGFSRYTKEQVLFEEYPVNQEIAVLNGNLIATIALYDYANFSQRVVPKQLAQRSVNWLQNNVHRYVINHPDYPNPVSAYSLAPSRLDLLFRFYLTNNSLDIFSIELIGDNVTRFIMVGSKKDDNISNAASLIVSPDMNWSAAYSDPQAKTHGQFRKIIQGLGGFNHAPFRMEINSASELAHLSNTAKIKITYRAQGSSDIQISDGRTFYKVGTLSPTDGRVVDLTLDIPQAAIANIQFPDKLKHNALYFEHNQKLLGIVAEIADSDILKKYSDLLKH
ncbi:hypothetical protein ICJ54_08810 [Pseudomonas asiatica]|uniref:D-glucuronyl C5-epimerase family protein n=1 Tax=Pseudomonas asiatica TaxID=2219225 RepID=UPI001665CFCA|nr:D-glucuronyl C5-epimerase family protein [Pseudomonas asiatica]QNT42388.1 hypothetical protein ICJ54_08810 [Pseudomonas asiatica]